MVDRGPFLLLYLFDLDSLDFLFFNSSLLILELWTIRQGLQGCVADGFFRETERCKEGREGEGSRDQGRSLQEQPVQRMLLEFS